MYRTADSNIKELYTLDKFSVMLADILRTENSEELNSDWRLVSRYLGNRRAKAWRNNIESVIELTEEMRDILDNQPRELIDRSDTEGLTTVSESLNGLGKILRVILNPEYEANNVFMPALNSSGPINGRLRVEGRGQIRFFEPTKAGYKETMLNMISGQPFSNDHTNGDRAQHNPGYHKALFGILRPLSSEHLNESKRESLNEVLQKQFPKIMQVCALGEALRIDNRLTRIDKLEAEFRSADFLYHSLLPEINPLMSIQTRLLDNEQARAVWDSAPASNQEIQSAHAKINSMFEMDLPHWDIKDSLEKKQDMAKSLKEWYEETINHKLYSNRREIKEQAIRGRIATLDCLIKMTDEEHVQMTKIKSQLNDIESKALKETNSRLKRAHQQQQMKARQEAQAREARQRSSQAGQGGSQAEQSNNRYFFGVFSGRGAAEESERAERESARAERESARAERESARVERVTVERDQAIAERNQASRERDQAKTQRDQANADRNQARDEREELDQTVKQLRSRVLAATLGALILCVASVFLTWGIAVYGVTGFAGVVYSALYIGVVHLPIILEFIFNVATATIAVTVPIGFWLDSMNSNSPLSIIKFTFGILILGQVLLGKAALLGLLWTIYRGARLIAGIAIGATILNGILRILGVVIIAVCRSVFNILAGCVQVFTQIIIGFGRFLGELMLGVWGLFLNMGSAIVYMVKKAFLILKWGAVKFAGLLKANPLVSLGVGALACVFAKLGMVNALASIAQLGITCSYFLGLVLASYIGGVCLFLTSFIAVKVIVALSKGLTGYKNPVWAVGLTAAAVVVLYFSPVRIMTCVIGLAFRLNWVKDVLDRVVQSVLARGGSPKFGPSSQQDEAEREESWSFNGHQSKSSTGSQYSGAAREEYSNESKSSRNIFFTERQSQRSWDVGTGYKANDESKKMTRESCNFSYRQK